MTTAEPEHSLAGGGAWQEGDPNGRRQWFRTDEPLALRRGGLLPGYQLAYETWGQLAEDGSNAVLVLHALTGDSHLAGPAEPGHSAPGWWGGLLGPGCALDPREHFIVVPNALGGCQGSTGPASLSTGARPWGGRFPALTIRDMCAAEVALADELGVESWSLVVGGSMGGMRALEWAVMFPDRVRRLLVLAANAAASADQIAWSSAQIGAIRADPGWRGGDYHAEAGAGPRSGLGIARRIAHATYRTASEFDARFGRSHQNGENPHAGGRFAVESYLDHHAAKLTKRFDAASYVLLSEAMNLHDVGRDRGGIDAALDRVRATTAVAGVDTDRLFPLAQQEELAERIRGCGEPRILSSRYGHDGFLIETEQVAKVISELLERPSWAGTERAADQGAR